MARLARLLVPIALVALASLVPAAEAAGIKAKTSMTTKSGETRLGVKLTSGSRLSDRKRPRKVRVKGGGATYKLSRVRGASAAVVQLGTWRSGAYRGAAAQPLLGLAGKTVRVIVTSRAGTTTLRSKVVGSTPAPGTDSPPGTNTPTTPDRVPGDITGQQAIDQMTAELRGGFLRDVSSSGSTAYEFHMCTDDSARYYSQSFTGGYAFVTEKFGKPWAVVEAVIRANGYKAAIVDVTWTLEHDDTGAYKQSNQPFSTLIEYANGQWYWEGALASTGQASCDPTF